MLLPGDREAIENPVKLNISTNRYKNHWKINQLIHFLAEMQTNPYPVLNPNPKPGFLENFQTQNPNPELDFWKPETQTRTRCDKF